MTEAQENFTGTYISQVMLALKTPITRNYVNEPEKLNVKRATRYIATGTAMCESTAAMPSPQSFSRNAKVNMVHSATGKDLSYSSPVASMKNLQLYYRDIDTEKQSAPLDRYAASGSIRSRVAVLPPTRNATALERSGKPSHDKDSVNIWQRGCFLQEHHSSDNTKLGLVDENRLGTEYGYEDEDEDPYQDEDEDELGEDDGTVETFPKYDANSYTDLRVSSSLNVDNIQSHASGHEERGSGRLSTPRKRSAPQGLAGNSHDDMQDDDNSTGKPSKRPKEQKGAKDVLNYQIKRPFACPYFKKNPLKYENCADWRNTKLSLVKTHCRSEHLKSRCPRCKTYRGIPSDIKKHLEDEDCEKLETYDSSEEKTTEEKIQELNKAKTWRRIYEVLFPLYIPDQFWQNTLEALVAPNDEDELSFSDRVQHAVSIRERAYRVAISEFLRDRAGTGDIDQLLQQFDKVLESKSWGQDSIHDNDNSKTIQHASPVYWDQPKEPPKAEQSSASSLIHKHATPRYETQSKQPTSIGEEDFEHQLQSINNFNNFPGQTQYLVEHLVPAQDSASSQVDTSNFSNFQQDLLGQSFTNDPGSQDMHDYVNVDDDMFEYGGDEAFEDIAEDLLEPGGIGYSL